MTQSLKGRSVAVTGGSKGIGKGIARVFAQAGAKVGIIARNLEAAEAAAKEIGHGAFGVAGDVTSKASMEKALAEVAKRNGGLDVLCANAGIFPPARLEEMTEAQWDEVQNTNLKGTFLSVQAAVPYLKTSDQGRIVLTSSITGPVTGFPGWTHYGSTKAGQLGFMRTACLELAKYGITVNAVLPLKKLGVVDDIGHAALYFASKEASYVTGQTIIVDGGQILPESLDALAQA
jgi:3-oxoacyl-[acyl-carrier protein] reductase